MNLCEILHKEELTKEEIIFLLNLNDKNDQQKLFDRADEVRSIYCGDEVHLRGIIEFSNYCEQNCLYCGLREDNNQLTRYRMTPEEIIETAHVISNLGIFTIVLQSGEDNYYDTDLVSYIIYQIKQNTNAVITLSLGERRFDEYREWKIAGADRYLLRHETASTKLYSTYHKKQKLEDRISHLSFLKTIGYQIGSGNMIGLPMQTIEDIADDILLCKELDLDMAAFGPFIPSPNTPYQNKSASNVDLTLRTMATARIVLKKVHIPAITALATLDDDGRIKGLNAGANIVMPDLTPRPYREQYQIYPDKKCIDDNPLNYKDCLQLQIEAVGRKISNSRSDSIKLTHQVTE
ncbi:MAG: [FeFe] hydrogenase H-cluster radical SAM maturase HydE [Ignavibacteriales bacterium]|nr:[FeFe] hydrogenase H-cluster radical SAM maturase HydE [Ignavibacteriales bacterium]